MDDDLQSQEQSQIDGNTQDTDSESRTPNRRNSLESAISKNTNYNNEFFTTSVPELPPIESMPEIIQEPVLGKEKEVDPFGFFIDSEYASPREPISIKIKTQTRQLEQQWILILDDLIYKPNQKISRKVKRLCRLGIPESVRGRVWLELSGGGFLLRHGPNSLVFERLSSSINDNNLDIFQVIERDLHRTLPHHIFFAGADSRGQKYLRTVLRCYAIYNPSIGYCQGMGMISAMLLLHMSPEDAFWTLVALIDGIFVDYFGERLIGLRIDAVVFEELIARKISRNIYSRIQELGVLSFLSQWFMSAFTVTTPWKTTLRIWDMLVCDGPKVLFRAGLAILKQNKTELSKLNGSDILARLISAPKLISNDEMFVRECLKIGIGKEHLDILRSRVKNKHKIN